jgi:hypothetical protein
VCLCLYMKTSYTNNRPVSMVYGVRGLVLQSRLDLVFPFLFFPLVGSPHVNGILGRRVGGPGLGDRLIFSHEGDSPRRQPRLGLGSWLIFPHVGDLSRRALWLGSGSDVSPSSGLSSDSDVSNGSKSEGGSTSTRGSHTFSGWSGLGSSRYLPS